MRIFYYSYLIKAFLYFSLNHSLKSCGSNISTSSKKKLKYLFAFSCEHSNIYSSLSIFITCGLFVSISVNIFYPPVVNLILIYCQKDIKGSKLSFILSINSLSLSLKDVFFI